MESTSSAKERDLDAKWVNFLHTKVMVDQLANPLLQY